MKSPTITSDRYIIRPFKMSDAELWQKWDTDLDVQAFMPEPRSEVQDIKEQYAYIDECENDNEGFYWSVETLDGITIGTVALTEYNEYHGIASLGVVIGDKSYWGKGVATEVITSLVKYAFEHLKIYRISAEVEEGNGPMMRVLEKIGFKQDGLFESARIKNNRRITVSHFGIVKPTNQDR